MHTKRRNASVTFLTLAIVGGLLGSGLLMVRPIERLVRERNDGTITEHGDCSSPGPFVLVSVLRYRVDDESGYESTYLTRTVSYVDESHIRIEREIARPGPAEPAQSRTITTGTLRFREDVDGGGSPIRQTMQFVVADTPVYFRDVGVTGSTPGALERLVDPAVPVVSVEDVDDLVARSVITDSGTTMIVGRVARILDIPGGLITGTVHSTRSYRITVDAECGIKLEQSFHSLADQDEILQAVSLELDATIPDSAFEVNLVDAAVNDSVLTRRFDLSDDYSYPDGAASVWTTEGGVVNGYGISDQFFITATETINGVRSASWVVTNEITGEDERYAIVLQATDGHTIPSGHALQDCWPGNWAVSDPTVVEGGVFVSRSEVQLGEGVTGELFRVDSALVESGAVEFKYVLTWLLSGSIRVALLAKASAGSESVVVAMAEAFIGSVGTPPPTRTPTSTLTPIPMLTSTPTPTPAVFGPSADAYTLSTNPTQNYGTSEVLNIRGGSSPYYRSFLKFDVSGISGTVVSAILRLWVSDTSVDYGELGSVSSSWTETGLTWNNQPGIPMNPLPVTGPENGYVTIDVTSEITASGIYSFDIQSQSTDLAAFSSREATTSEHRPLLTIVTQ